MQGFLRLPPSASAPAQARQFLRTRLSGAAVPTDLTDTVLLLTSELVTNAVLHGRSEVEVELSSPDGRLRVAVSDENSRHPLRVEDDTEALDGRGLLLIDGLATSWGVQDKPLGKSVWFELGVSGGTRGG